VLLQARKSLIEDVKLVQCIPFQCSAVPKAYYYCEMLFKVITCGNIPFQFSIILFLCFDLHNIRKCKARDFSLPLASAIYIELVG